MITLALDIFGKLPPIASALILAASVITALLCIHRYIVNPVRSYAAKVNRGMDTILGYPEVRDPGTGREIQPATPALADRVWNLEQSNLQVAKAISQMADLQAAIEERSLTLASLVEWKDRHDHEAMARQERLDHWEQIITSHIAAEGGSPSVVINQNKQRKDG